MFHDSDDIEKLAEEVQAEHALRLGGCDTIPMVPRKFKPRARPQTSIISRAVESKIAAMDMEQVLARALTRWKGV